MVKFVYLLLRLNVRTFTSNVILLSSRASVHQPYHYQVKYKSCIVLRNRCNSTHWRSATGSIWIGGSIAVLLHLLLLHSIKSELGPVLALPTYCVSLHLIYVGHAAASTHSQFSHLYMTPQLIFAYMILFKSWLKKHLFCVAKYQGV